MFSLLLFAAPLGYVSNFKVTSYTSTSIDVEWSPIVGATEYKLSWNAGNICSHVSPLLRFHMGTSCFHRPIKLWPVRTIQTSLTCLQVMANLSLTTWTTAFSSIGSKTWTHIPPTPSPSVQCMAMLRDQKSPYRSSQVQNRRAVAVFSSTLDLNSNEQLCTPL